MPTGSTVFLDVSSCVVSKEELAQLKKDSAELAEIKEAVKDVEVDPVTADEAPAPIEEDDLPQRWN